MNYPDGEALEAYLAELSARALLPESFDFDRRARAAAQEFEKAVDWRPFLSSGSSQSRTFHAPASWGHGWSEAGMPVGVARSFGDDLIDLKGGLLTLGSITGGSVPLIADVDYRLDRFGDEAGPIQAIHFFRSGLTAWSGSIVVTGVWGRFAQDDLPEDVYEAILAKGALLCLSTLANQPSGALIQKKAGPVEEQYAKPGGKDRTSALADAFASAVEAYRFAGVS